MNARLPVRGREGVRLIEEEEFDIVLTDLLMSDVDGMGVLAKARKELPHAEVVILTGRNETQDAVAAIQAGAAEYLIKPLDIGKLRAVVDRGPRPRGWRARTSTSSGSLTRSLASRASSATRPPCTSSSTA